MKKKKKIMLLCRQYGCMTRHLMTAVACGPHANNNLKIATLILSSGQSKFGSELAYLCPQGYFFSTEVFTQTITCDKMAQWSPVITNDCHRELNFSDSISVVCEKSIKQIKFTYFKAFTFIS